MANDLPNVRSGLPQVAVVESPQSDPSLPTQATFQGLTVFVERHGNPNIPWFRPNQQPHPFLPRGKRGPPSSVQLVQAHPSLPNPASPTPPPQPAPRPRSGRRKVKAAATRNTTTTRSASKRRNFMEYGPPPGETCSGMYETTRAVRLALSDVGNTTTPDELCSALSNAFSVPKEILIRAVEECGNDRVAMGHKIFAALNDAFRDHSALMRSAYDKLANTDMGEWAERLAPYESTALGAWLAEHNWARDADLNSVIARGLERFRHEACWALQKFASVRSGLPAAQGPAIAQAEQHTSNDFSSSVPADVNLIEFEDLFDEPPPHVAETSVSSGGPDKAVHAPPSRLPSIGAVNRALKRVCDTTTTEDLCLALEEAFRFPKEYFLDAVKDCGNDKNEIGREIAKALDSALAWQRKSVVYPEYLKIHFGHANAEQIARQLDAAIGFTILGTWLADHNWGLPADGVYTYGGSFPVMLGYGMIALRAQAYKALKNFGVAPESLPRPALRVK